MPDTLILTDKTGKEYKEAKKIETIPFKKGFWKFGKKINTKPKKDYNLKEAMLILIRGNNDAEILEGVKEGKLSIEKGEGQGKKTVEIHLPRSKLINIKWGETTTKTWIASENEAIALPTNVVHDSLTLKKIIGALIMNYKDYETKKMDSWVKIVMWIVIGIIGLVVVSAVFNFPLLPWQAPPTPAPTPAATGQTLTTAISLLWG